MGFGSGGSATGNMTSRSGGSNVTFINFVNELEEEINETRKELNFCKKEVEILMSEENTVSEMA